MYAYDMIASNVPGVVVDGVDMGDLECLGHGQSTEHVLLSRIHSRESPIRRHAVEFQNGRHDCRLFILRGRGRC